MTIRLLLVDDHEIVRQGLRRVLEERPAWTIVGEAADGRTAIALALQHRPDVAIVDVSMPELNGLELTRRLKQELPAVEVLVLTMHDAEGLVHEVLAAGARGYVLKSDAGHALIDAVEALLERKPFLSPGVSDVVLRGYLRGSPTEPAHPLQESDPAAPLTAREREIVQLIAEGKSTKEVASRLNISVKTAETHRTNLMRKLRVRSVSELVRYAIRNKIVEP